MFIEALATPLKPFLFTQNGNSIFLAIENQMVYIDRQILKTTAFHISLFMFQMAIVPGGFVFALETVKKEK